ncbi:MAG: hypothetical protein NVS3B5_00340 [Sphingomicrobium sp.]
MDHRMAVMREESFGPVVGLMPVTSEAEAVRLINDSPDGLTGSVWTRDVEAGERITAQLDVGTAFMNRCDALDAALAWTGVRDSGRGASLGRFGFESVTRPKSLHLRLAR